MNMQAAIFLSAVLSAPTEAFARVCVKWQLPQTFEFAHQSRKGHFLLERAPPAMGGGNAVPFYGTASMQVATYRPRRTGRVDGVLHASRLVATVKWRDGSVTNYSFPVRQVRTTGQITNGTASGALAGPVRGRASLLCASRMR